MTGRVHFDSTLVARSQRPKRWREELSHIHGDVEIQEIEGGDLSGHLTRASLWRLQIYKLDLSPHRIALPQIMARPGTHHFTKLHFQIAGTMHFVQDGVAIDLSPGDCLVFNFAWPHELSSDRYSEHLGLLAPHDLIRRLSVPIEMLRTAHHIKMDNCAEFALDILKRYLEENPSFGEAAGAKLAEAVLALMRSSLAEGEIGLSEFSGPTIIRWRAKNYINSNLRNSELDISNVAAALGCSKRTLHAAFREESATIERYIWEKRLEECHAELSRPDSVKRTITDIAFTWGFSSSAHFSRTFRAAYGKSPTSVRAAMITDRCDPA
jgi:AraC-like DNA-binding protein